jgi:hypothetical protein
VPVLVETYAFNVEESVMSLDIDGQSARRLLEILDWTELGQESLPLALCGTYEIPTEGTFTIVSSSSGQDVTACDGWLKLVGAIGTLYPGFYHVLFEGKKVVILMTPGQKWRLFVSRTSSASSGAPDRLDRDITV